MKRLLFLSGCVWVVLAGSLVLAAQAAPSSRKGMAPALVSHPLFAGALAAAAPAAGPSAGGQKSQQSSDSEVDTSIYRHSASVRAVARLLHVEDETAAQLFDYSNFTILAAGVLFLFFKYLPKILRERRERIAQQLVEARNATEQAKDRLRAVEGQFARLDEEIARIRAHAEQDSSAAEARIKATIEAERERIVASAEQEIRAAVSAARRDLKRFAGELAVDRAERMISLSEESDQALLRRFAGSLGEERRNGGGHE